MVDAILPQLRLPHSRVSSSPSAADTVIRAQTELVTTLRVLLVSPGHALPEEGGGVEGVVARPVRQADAGGSDAVALPRDLSDEEIALEVSLLTVTARVVRTCGDAMPPPLCSRALLLLQAVVVLPAAVAARRDPSWRVAFGALCQLSSARADVGVAAAAAAAPAGVSRLASPLLAAAAMRVLTEWAETSNALVAGTLLAVRAEQLLLLLSEMTQLRLPHGSLGASAGASEALASLLLGERAQLLVLMPALVACIGKPNQPAGSATEAVQRLHEALRGALLQVVDELGFHLPCPRVPPTEMQ